MQASGRRGPATGPLASHSQLLWYLLGLVLAVAVLGSNAVPSEAVRAFETIPLPASAPALAQEPRKYVGRTGTTPKERKHAVEIGHRTAADAPVELLDVALVSCTDGSLFGLNRTTGTQLWSLRATASHEASSLFGPTVKVAYGSQKLDFADLLSRMGPNAVESFLDDVGLYVLEPSATGDIYLLTKKDESSDHFDPTERYRLRQPGLTLSKVPLSLPQLVSLSPFTFAGDESKIFIGKKDTKLVEINLLTGEIGAVFGQEAMLSERRPGTSDLSLGPGSTTPRRSSQGWTLIGRTGECDHLKAPRTELTRPDPRRFHLVHSRQVQRRSDSDSASVPLRSYDRRS